MNTTLEYSNARVTRADRWVPANGGHEQPFVKDGSRWLYVFNFRTGQHGYLHLDTDIVHEVLGG